MQTTRLSDIPNGVLQFPDKRGGLYTIKFDRTDLLILRFGFDAHKSSYHKLLNHERLLAVIPAVHEYKHYRQSGSKFWTARAGIDLYFAVPASAVEVEHYEGLSYVNVYINGQKIILNVSGGGGSTSSGWTDMVHECSCTSTNMKPAVLKALLEVALPVDSVVTERKFELCEYFSAERWQELVARHKVEVKEGMELALVKGLNYDRYLFAKYKYRAGGRTWVCDYRPAGATVSHGSIRVPLSKVDFLETAKLNNVALLDPATFMRVPVSSE